MKSLESFASMRHRSLTSIASTGTMYVYSVYTRITEQRALVEITWLK